MLPDSLPSPVAAVRKYETGMRWAFWRWTDVSFGGELYLRRLHLLKTPLFSVMLHWILRPDPQTDPHDHPVTFLSLVLRGWYVEWRDYFWHRRRVVRWWNLVRARDVHQIIQVAPRGCVTLVLAGPKVREWGYWTRTGWRHWKEYQK